MGEATTEASGLTGTSVGIHIGPTNYEDIVMYVRLLPNPYYMPKMRPRTGQDRVVSDFVLERVETKAFLDKWEPLLTELAPNYLAEGKHHPSIALGCTGGMHRSVVLAEETARHLRSLGYQVAVRHRDISRDQEWM